MASQVSIEKKRYKELEKEKMELEKWQLQSKANRKNRFYFIYLFFILCLAYIVDEIATNIHSAVQTEVLDTFFNGESGLSAYTIVLTLCSSIAIFTFFWRTLADKYGRRPFLVANIVGMAIGMFFCFFTKGLPGYIIGLLFIYFFIPNDIQVLYVLETSKPEKKALNLAISKGIGVLGVSVVGALKKYYVTGTNWQNVFLIPAIIGLFAAIIALAFVKESDVFMKDRMEYLKRDIKLGYTKIENTNKKPEDTQGGLINAIRYMIRHRALLWIFIILTIFSICSVGSANYALILSEPSIPFPLTEDEIYLVIFIYPFFTAIVTILNGVFSDVLGRKIATIFSCSCALLGILFFYLGIRFNWNRVFIGVCLGLFIGGYLASIDTCNVMGSEESPTNLRASILSVMGIGLSVGSFIGTGLLLIFQNLIADLDVGLFIIILTAPALAGALAILFTKIPETKGMDLSKLSLKRFFKSNDE